VPGGRRLLPALALLYLGQGLPMGLAFEAVPTLLRAEGASAARIGLVGLAILPWALRFLWAPLVDRWSGGRRAAWLLPSQLLLLLLYAGLAALPAELPRAGMALWGAILASLIAATQNTATDGLAVLALPRGRMGWANAFQVGGFSLGMLAGGGPVLILGAEHGWAWGWLPALAITLAALPLLLRQGAAHPPVAPRGPIGLRRFLARPGAAAMLLVAATFYFGRAFVGDLIGPVLLDSGLGVSFIGVTRIASTGAMAFGAVALGGWLVTRFGAGRVGPVAGVLWAASLGAWALLARPGLMPAEAILLSVADGLAGGVTYAAFLTLFMRWASARQGGTDVTILMCAESVSNILATLLGALVASLIGLSATFGLAALLMLGAMARSRIAIPQIKTEDSPYAHR
jgi:MFS family permease